MNEQEIFKGVEKVVRFQLGFEGMAQKIDMGSNYVEDLGADSLDMVELVMALEEELDLEIPDEDAEKQKTVGDTVKYLVGKVK